MSRVNVHVFFSKQMIINFTENKCILFSCCFLFRCLYTVESVRRQGLGRLLMEFHCKHFVELENLDVLAFVDADNDASFKLLQRIGFKILNECAWYRTIGI